MKKFPLWLKIVLSCLMVIVLFVQSYLVSFKIFNDTTVSSVNARDIAVSAEDPDCFFMKRTDPNIKFEVLFDTAKNPYRLTGPDGRKIDGTLIKGENDSSFFINPPKGGYKIGETYTLTLAKGAYFAETDLKKARKLIFTIRRDEVESCKFTDKVVKKDFTPELKSGNNLTLPDDAKLNVGDIVLGKDKNNTSYAYKIEALNGSVAEVSAPALDEIYEEINIYKEYDFDVSSIKANPNLEKEVMKNLLASSFYSDIMHAAYEGDEEVLSDFEHAKSPYSATNLSNGTTADSALLASGVSLDNYDFNFSVDESKNEVTFNITLPLQSGKEGLFGMEELKNHSVNLTLSSTMSAKAFVDWKDTKNWEISTNTKNTFSWSVDINLDSEKIKNDVYLSDLFGKSEISENHHKLVGKISRKLEEISKDKGGFELDLFTWKIPVGVDGVFFESEVELAFSFDMNADISTKNTYTTEHVAGIICKKDEFFPYKNEYSTESSPTLSVRGNASFKFGVQMETKLCFATDDIAYIGVKPQIGAYADVYAFAPVLSAEDFGGSGSLYAYAEPGVYMQASFDAYINLSSRNDIYFGPVTFEKKWPSPSEAFGLSEIPLGLEISESVIFVDGKKAELPKISFDCLDAASGTIKSETLKLEDYVLCDEDGDKISVSNGKITVSDKIPGDGMKITVKYTHENGKNYTTNFVLTTSESYIEGQVSAFNRKGYKPVEKADIELLNGSGNPIASKTTNSDGSFNFNVSPGTYKIRISADGYKPLITTQSVGKEEIKYTEHILLISERMKGAGSSSGYINNALTGKGIDGVKLRLRENWNNTSGAYVKDFSISTNSDGYYHIENVPIGYYTLEASADGYHTSHSNILVISGNDPVSFDFAMTPHIKEGTARIILTWGEKPSDLDSYLIGKTLFGREFNVCYKNKAHTFFGKKLATLDLDDTSNYGPETMTILKNIRGTCTYAIHDFSNEGSTTSNAMSSSGAKVTVVVGGSNKVHEFHVPMNKTGVWWNVFTIDSDLNITPVNTISNKKPKP